MNRFVRVLPFAVVALLLMPESITSATLIAVAGGAACTHKATDPDVECTRSDPNNLCSGRVTKCYGQPLEIPSIRCNIEGEQTLVCTGMTDCLGTRPDKVYTETCTIPPQTTP